MGRKIGITTIINYNKANFKYFKILLQKGLRVVEKNTTGS